MKTGFLFPGQGAQYVGMGKELAQRCSCADKIYNEADDILGTNLKKIIFEGPESELTDTHNSQPAIFVTSAACLQVMKEEGLEVNPSAAAGLSLGEFTALYAAGVFGFADVLKLVRQRGTFMQEACRSCPGAMASIMGLEEKSVREICREAEKTGLVDIANVNCPGQIVVSGSREGVKKAVALAEARENSRVVELKVAGAFHSRLMQPARIKLEAILKSIPMQKPRFPVYLNVIGDSCEDPEKIRKLLAQQVTSSVLWHPGIERMIRSGIETFIEVGCGRVLCGLLKRINRQIPCANVEDIKSLENTKKFIEGLSVKS